MLNKNFIFFLLSAILFTSAAIFLSTIYWSWNKGPVLDGDVLEVSLPVINWEKYMNLSKHLD